MAAVAWGMLVWVAVAQAVPQIDLHDLTAAPSRYQGKLVQVRGTFWVLAESAHLCSDRLDPDDPAGCQAVMPDKGPGISQRDWERVLEAARLAATGNYRVWLTVRGRFEAADPPRWGAYAGYGFRIQIEKVVRVETKKRVRKR